MFEIHIAILIGVIFVGVVFGIVVGYNIGKEVYNDDTRMTFEERKKRAIEFDFTPPKRWSQRNTNDS